MYPTRAMRSWIFGIMLPYRALCLILKHRGLAVLSLLPLFLAALLSYFIFQSLNEYALRYLSGFITSDYLRWISYLLQLILFIAVSLAYSFLAGLVALPFNDFLAEKTESYCVPALPPPPHEVNHHITSRFRLIWIDLIKTLMSGFILLLCFLMSWIPIVHFFAAALAFVVMTLQYISFPQTRRFKTFRDDLRFVFTHPFACLGFGMILTTCFAVPILGAFMLPLAVVGGTLLVAHGQDLT